MGINNGGGNKTGYNGTPNHCTYYFVAVIPGKGRCYYCRVHNHYIYRSLPRRKVPN